MSYDSAKNGNHYSLTPPELYTKLDNQFHFDFDSRAARREGPHRAARGRPHGGNMTLADAKLEAVTKAFDALAKYKFMMFGYWAAIWVHMNHLDDKREPNPFQSLVHEARKERTRKL